MPECKFRPINDPTLLQPTDLIKHIPRGTQYWIICKCQVKTESGAWVEGVAYQETDAAYGATVYVRPLDKFDDDWNIFS